MRVVALFGLDVVPVLSPVPVLCCYCVGGVVAFVVVLVLVVVGGGGVVVLVFAGVVVVVGLCSSFRFSWFCWFCGSCPCLCCCHPAAVFQLLGVWCVFSLLRCDYLMFALVLASVQVVCGQRGF